MGLPNSELFLSQRDQNAMEFNFLSKPTSEFQDFGCQIAPKEVSVEKQEEEERDHQKDIIKRPSLGELKEEDDDEGFRTPTNLEQRIALVPRQCPPAPKKPKSLPLTTKRSSKAARRRFLIDLSEEIESLFPPAFLADLGGKIKKARKVYGTN